METLIGIACKDFVLMAADRTMTFGVLAVKQDAEKVVRLDTGLVLGVSGEAGDTVQFADFVHKNVQLYRMRNGFPLSPASAAHFVRRTLADALRSRSPYQVNCLLAGFDHVTGRPLLFHMDHLAACVPLPFAMHGYASFLTTSILDKWYDPNASPEQAVDLMRRVIAQTHKRLVLNMPAFRVVKIDKEGITDLPDIRIDVNALGL